MKSLKESLFDDNVVQSDILLGDRYRLSDESFHNEVSNNIRNVLAMFDEKTLKNEKFHHKVPKDHGFIEHWKKYDSRIDLFIDMILNIPLQYIEPLFSEQYNGFKHVSNYLSKYFSYHGGKAKEIYVYGRELRNENIELTIYDSVRSSRPSSIKLTFKRK